MIRAIREFAFPDAPGDLFDAPDAMIRMGVPPLRIEILKSISGVDFEECWTNRVFIRDDDADIPMISLNDLKRNKRALGRKKDLLDLDELP